MTSSTERVVIVGAGQAGGRAAEALRAAGFAGEVVLLVMAFLLPWLLPSIFYGYELFVAFIQAFIFAILAMVFISLATESHGGHDDHGHTATDGQTHH